MEAEEKITSIPYTHSFERQKIELNRSKKEALIRQAAEIKTNTRWKETTTLFLNLQKEWKTIGNTTPGADYKFWLRFRAECDAFFNNKAGHFKNIEVEQTHNYQAKLEITQLIELFEPTNNTQESVEVLKRFITMWNSIGSVPPKRTEEINQRYFKIIHDKVAGLIRQDSASADNYVERKMELLKLLPAPERLVEKEIKRLRKKMETCLQEKKQYENNLGFLKYSSEALLLRQEINVIIVTTEQQITGIKNQIIQLQSILY